MNNNLPILPTEIVDIILSHNLLDCVNVSKRYRDIAINFLSLEYVIDKDDFLQYFETGISSSLFVDFKCFFCMNPQWIDIKNQELFIDFLEIYKRKGSTEKICNYGNYIFEYIVDYLKKFAESVKRNIYQVDIDFICLYKCIFVYLAPYYEFDMLDFFRLNFSGIWGMKRDIFGEKLLRDKFISNTEHLDIVKLARSLYDMRKQEHYYYGRDSNIYWYISLFIARYNMVDDDLADQFMKMQELFEEKILLEKTDDGFKIIISKNGYVFVTYGYNKFCCVSTFNNENEKEIEFMHELEIIM